MYSKYISWFVNFASSSAAIRSWSCLDVLLSARNPSWLSCNIYVRVLVKSLYIVFASAIGLWFANFDGSPFLYNSMVMLIFHDVGICFCL